MEPAIMRINNKMKTLMIKRQKGNNVLKTASWALYHRSELKKLIAAIASLIDNLDALFPAPQSQIALAKEETAQIHDKKSLKLIETAAQDVDGPLQTAAKEALTGHQYSNVNFENKRQAGDLLLNDWTEKTIGAFYKYGEKVSRDLGIQS